jgi:hypothetical protein
MTTRIDLPASSPITNKNPKQLMMNGMKNRTLKAAHFCQAGRFSKMAAIGFSCGTNGVIKAGDSTANTARPQMLIEKEGTDKRTRTKGESVTIERNQNEFNEECDPILNYLHLKNAG